MFHKDRCGGGYKRACEKPIVYDEQGVVRMTVNRDVLQSLKKKRSSFVPPERSILTFNVEASKSVVGGSIRLYSPFHAKLLAEDPLLCIPGG